MTTTAMTATMLTTTTTMVKTMTTTMTTTTRTKTRTTTTIANHATRHCFRNLHLGEIRLTRLGPPSWLLWRFDFNVHLRSLHGCAVSDEKGYIPCT